MMRLGKGLSRQAEQVGSQMFAGTELCKCFDFGGAHYVVCRERNDREDRRYLGPIEVNDHMMHLYLLPPGCKSVE